MTAELMMMCAAMDFFLGYFLLPMAAVIVLVFAAFALLLIIISLLDIPLEAAMGILIDACGATVEFFKKRPPKTFS